MTAQLDFLHCEPWRKPTAAKAALYVAMREAGVSKMELARRLGVDEKEVRRMLDPGHGSKLPRIAEAIEALGRHLRIALA